MTDQERAGLAWHLDANFYPPQGDAIDLAEEAINACNAGQEDDTVTLPDGSEVTYGQIVEDLRLEDYITAWED